VTTRPAVVFDVNVFVDAFIGADSTWPLLDSIPPTTDNASADCVSLAFDAEDFRLVISPHILKNIGIVLRRVGLTEELTAKWIAATIDIVELTGGIVIEPERHVFDVADHEDNLILDLAVATDALLVVSNDADLTSLSPWHGRIPILRPRDFVARMVQTRRRL
jgi:putative PIN family toxin of toxin-antitoxin system